MIGGGEIAFLNEPMQLIEIGLQLINHFMQTAVDQRLNADVTPLGHELTAQAFEVVR